jgi:hypothetical protein
MKVRITGINEGPAAPTAGPGGGPTSYNVALIDITDGTGAAGGPGTPGTFTIPLRDVSALTVSKEYELELKPTA